MNSLKIVQPMLDHIAKIDFTTTAEANYGISVFETNIRYLGGLLSGEYRSQYGGGYGTSRRLTVRSAKGTTCSRDLTSTLELIPRRSTPS